MPMQRFNEPACESHCHMPGDYTIYPYTTGSMIIAIGDLDVRRDDGVGYSESDLKETITSEGPYLVEVSYMAAWAEQA